MMKTEETISKLVRDSLPGLSPHLREWAEAHLVTPVQKSFAMDPDRNEQRMLWLVTDHTGKNDSGYRIIFDDDMQMFGLAATLQNGTAWCMGLYANFQETVENM